MQTQKELCLSNGMVIVMRKPSPEEATEYLDKRAIAIEGGGKLNALDDGDGEILQCILSPSKEEMLELLEEYPGLSSDLRDAYKQLGNDGIRVESAPELVTEDLIEEQKTKRLIGYHIENQPLVASKVSRTEVKFFEREIAKLKRIPRKMLAIWADTHVLPKYEETYKALRNQHPFLPVLLGMDLYGHAHMTVQEAEGK